MKHYLGLLILLGTVSIGTTIAQESAEWSGVVVSIENSEEIGSYLDDWTAIIPDEWLASSPETARYEIRFVPTLLAPEEYQCDAVTLINIQVDVEVVITDLATNEELARRSFEGNRITGCPFFMIVSSSTATSLYLQNPYPDFAQWLLETLNATDDMPALNLPYPGTPLALVGHTDVVESAGYSPDGSRIVTASRDGTARVWDVESGDELLRLVGHTDSVVSVAYSPDGRHIVSASWDGTARIWDAGTGEELIQMIGYTDRVRSANYDPDGSTIVTAGDNTTRVWDAETGEAILVLQGHRSWVDSASYSPDGQYILTLEAGEVFIWDSTTGEELRRVFKFNGHLHSASYSPDGNTIAIARDDFTAQIWDISDLADTS